ncbi:DNA polymerase delta subunit 1 [Aureococcus anophagefferens]|uniref:DNA polymerase n=2 Tax=Aureococcus anophagefferens TaxID=44056 RepID=A0ABR1GD91_AURAN
MDFDDIPDDVLEEFEDEIREAGGDGSQMAVDEVDWETKFLRPKPKAGGTVAFQWTSIDMYTGDPLATHPRQGQRVPGSRNRPVPVVRLYGVTGDGASVCAHCHGFTPYCFSSAPLAFDESDAGNVAKLQQALDGALRQRCSRGQDRACAQLVLGVEVVRDKRSIMGYQPDGARACFFKIYVALPTQIPALKKVLQDGVNVPGVGHSQLQTFESNVPFILRFMIDNEIQGCNWVEAPAGAYAARSGGAKKTRCDLEIDVVFDSLVSHAPDGPWAKLAPLRIMATDIECMGRKGHFPEPEKDPVIQISCVVQVQGAAQPMCQVIFTLDGCTAINGAEVVTSKTEPELLKKWAAFVRLVDPDIITGYNTQNFDIPYLLKRAQTLKRKDASLAAFSELGRVLGSHARMRDTSIQSAQMGKRENVETTVDGRVMFDLLPYMFRNHKLSSYSLNSVCAEFLGSQKEDVHHSIIADLQRGTDEDRRRLAVYCLKDSYLVIQLMTKLAVLINYVEMARVTGVPLDFLLSRGQQIKVFSMLLRRCRASNLLVPNLAKHGNDGDAKFEGATVIEPKKAFYEEPIATLDFASLYPSIMQAYNLCYSTILTKQDAERHFPGGADTAYQAGPQCVDGVHHFVTAKTKRGVLPQILADLLAARKRAKADMKKATDPMDKAVQNGRQLALKISANSVYGFTGAAVGQLPCLPIASTVTAYGRTLLHRTKDFVESTYTKENGYAADAEVVYGDTDSVMVNFGFGDVAATLPKAEVVAAEVTKIFPPPVKLEFEKVYFPYLLMNKKRYAGLLWTRPETHDYMDCKGLETVRRDNCLLVRQLIDGCLRKIIIERDTNAAIAYAKRAIGDLLQNKIDISLLVITKSLSKEADSKDYKAKSGHAELAKRMRARDPGTAPNVGDRVPYVIVQAPKGTATYDKSEDPVYVLENNLPIDASYYLENQLSKPLTRIFEPIIPNTSNLLHGDHTRVVAKPTPVARKGGIMMFAKKQLQCLGCKAKIDEGTVCDHCKPREPEIFLKRVRDVNAHERTFAKLWTNCQRCQGSLHQDVLCSNSDCPVFYKRKKVQTDLRDTQVHLARFDTSW